MALVRGASQGITWRQEAWGHPMRRDSKAGGLEIKVRLGDMRPCLEKKYQKGIYTPIASSAFSKVLLFLEEDGARTREKTADLLA